MAGLPPLRRLLIEDFPDQKKWIGPLLLVVNNFFEAVVGALNKSLSIVQNTTSDLKAVVLSNVPTPNTSGGAAGPTSVAWSKNSAPVAVLVGNVTQFTGNPLQATTFTLSSAVQVQWSMSQDGKSLQITGVAGITPSSSTQYALTLICIAG